MKYPKYPIEPKERACWRVIGDMHDGYPCCPSITCESGYGVYCVDAIPCFGDCSNCDKTVVWRGRCRCYQLRMQLEEKKFKH